jgi:hypothetical protein
MNNIFISIASYRDPDLINTIKSIYDNAKNKERLFFSIVCYETINNFPDISFIPENQYSYNKIDYRIADGTCSSRHLANSILNKNYEYFLQIDSHTRVVKNWDEIIISEYKRCSEKWGENYVFSRYASSFIVDKNGNEIMFPTATFENEKDIPEAVDIRFSKLVPVWDDVECVWRSCGDPMYDKEWGEQSYSISAHLIFCKSEDMINVPYDPYLYFLGEEITLAIRFYINDIKIVSLPVDVLYHNYDRSNYKRDYHWTDNPNWKIRDQFSRKRLADFFYCKNLGPYGILDIEKYKKFQSEANINFENKIYIKPEYLGK